MKILEIARAFIIVTGVFVSLVAGKMTIRYAVDSYLPASHWMEYQNIEAVNAPLEVGKRPRFATTAVRYRTADLEWHDTIYCSEINDYGYYTAILPASSSSKLDAKPAYIGKPRIDGAIDDSYAQSAGLWTWDAGIPDFPSYCYLEAQVRIKPSPFVNKTITFRSQVFSYR